MLEKRKPYLIYSIPVYAGRYKEMAQLSGARTYGHACKIETSLVMAADLELVV